MTVRSVKALFLLLLASVLHLAATAKVTDDKEAAFPLRHQTQFSESYSGAEALKIVSGAVRNLQDATVDVLVVLSFGIFSGLIPGIDLGWTITDTASGDIVASFDLESNTFDPEGGDGQTTPMELQEGIEYLFEIQDNQGLLEELQSADLPIGGASIAIYLGLEPDNTKLLLYQTTGLNFEGSGGFTASASATLPPITRTPSASPTISPSDNPTVTSIPTGEQVDVTAALEFRLDIFRILPGWTVASVSTGEVVFESPYSFGEPIHDGIIPTVTFSLTKGEEYIFELVDDFGFVDEALGFGAELNFKFFIYLGREVDRSKVLFFLDGFQAYAGRGTFLASADATFPPVTEVPSASPTEPPSYSPTKTFAPTNEQIPLLLVLTTSFMVPFLPGWQLIRVEDEEIVFDYRTRYVGEPAIDVGSREPIEVRQEVMVDKDKEFMFSLTEFGLFGEDIGFEGDFQIFVFLGTMEDFQKVLFVQNGSEGFDGSFSFLASDTATLEPVTFVPSSSPTHTPSAAPTTTSPPTVEQVVITVHVELGESAFAAGWSVTRVSDGADVFSLVGGDLIGGRQTGSITRSAFVDKDEDYVLHINDPFAALDCCTAIKSAAVYLGRAIDDSRALVYVERISSEEENYPFTTAESALLPTLTGKPSANPSLAPSIVPTVTSIPTATQTNVTVVMAMGDIPFAANWMISRIVNDGVEIVYESSEWRTEPLPPHSVFSESLTLELGGLYYFQLINRFGFQRLTVQTVIIYFGNEERSDRVLLYNDFTFSRPEEMSFTASMDGVIANFSPRPSATSSMAPSLVPTLTFMPSSVLMPFKVVVEFDDAPWETGFLLSDAVTGETVVEKEPGTYDSSYSHGIVAIDVQLAMGHSYTMTVVDQGGNGISGQRHISVYFVDDEGEEQVLATMTGRFGSEAKTTIVTPRIVGGSMGEPEDSINDGSGKESQKLGSGCGRLGQSCVLDDDCCSKTCSSGVCFLGRLGGVHRPGGGK